MTIDVKFLATYRIAGKGSDYHARDMSPDEIAARRAYIRKTLSSFPRWCNLPNDVIDQIRLESIDRGYLAEDANGCLFLLPMAVVTPAETAFRQDRAMIPFEFLGLTGKDFDWSKYEANITEPRNVANKYIMSYNDFKEKGIGLYICSAAKGSGKTMLACCLANEITKRYHGTVKFINVLDFLELIKKANIEGESLQQLYEAGLLIIDDIGVQGAKEWSDSALYRLINDRYVNKRPTIYTSNISIEQLKMDDRIIDRIDSTTCIVNLPNEAIRKRERQQEKKKLLDSIK